VPQLTVAENVSVPLVLKGESVSASVRKANELLATLGLEGRGKAHRSSCQAVNSNVWRSRAH